MVKKWIIIFGIFIIISLIIIGSIVFYIYKPIPLGYVGVIDKMTNKIETKTITKSTTFTTPSCNVRITKTKFGYIIDLQDKKTNLDIAYDEFTAQKKIKESLIELEIGNCHLVWIGSNAIEEYMNITYINYIEEIRTA